MLISPWCQQALYHEALEWQNLRHPYVLPFLGMDSETFPSQFPCIVLPWMSNGTIMQYIKHENLSRIGIEGLVGVQMSSHSAGSIFL
jgi:hypothetical protein